MEEEPKLTSPYHDHPSFGIEPLDSQHKELSFLLNQVSSLIFNKTEDATVVRLLNQVIEKTALHFSVEEEFIREYCPPDEVAAHIRCHMEAISTLIALKNKLELDLIKYQIRYKSDMANFAERLFSYDASLVHRIKGSKISKLIPNAKIIEIP